MKKGTFGKITAALCIGFIVIYTVAVLYNFYVHNSEPTILTPLVYSFFGGELTLLFLKRRHDAPSNKTEGTRVERCGVEQEK